MTTETSIEERLKDAVNSLRGAQFIVRNLTCPTSWPTGTERPHSYECDVLSQAVRRATGGAA